MALRASGPGDVRRTATASASMAPSSWATPSGIPSAWRTPTIPSAPTTAYLPSMAFAAQRADPCAMPQPPQGVAPGVHPKAPPGDTAAQAEPLTDHGAPSPAPANFTATAVPSLGPPPRVAATTATAHARPGTSRRRRLLALRMGRRPLQSGHRRPNNDLRLQRLRQGHLAALASGLRLRHLEVPGQRRHLGCHWPTLGRLGMDRRSAERRMSFSRASSPTTPRSRAWTTSFS